MTHSVQQPRFRFSLLQLLLLVALISLWLAMVHYGGVLAVILTSSLIGGLLVLVGMVYRLRIVAVIGGVLLLAGPFLLGMAAAMLNS
ncbi:MAG TPA: hypothetical protein VFB96_12925 [Pirellulaceae bacterium]|jgi:hypothetical protein|nr:hypothetical protein [Pirellulaceae bacterium]